MNIQQTLPNNVFTYSDKTHRFFNELVRVVICYASIGRCVELHANGATMPYMSNDTVAMEGKHAVSGLEIHFFPRQVFVDLLSNLSPQQRHLKVIKRPINSQPPTHPIQLSNVQLLMARLIGDAFVSYYERHVGIAISKWGNERDGGWPAVWSFGWAIRNACSHDGKIFFVSPNHAPVTWFGLTYDYRDNGKQVLFDEMTGVELILLMEEMDLSL
jgi:hypothetical protein